MSSLSRTKVASETFLGRLPCPEGTARCPSAVGDMSTVKPLKEELLKNCEEILTQAGRPLTAIVVASTACFGPSSFPQTSHACAGRILPRSPEAATFRKMRTVYVYLNFLVVTDYLHSAVLNVCHEERLDPVVNAVKLPSKLNQNMNKCL